MKKLIVFTLILSGILSAQGGGNTPTKKRPISKNAQTHSEAEDSSEDNSDDEYPQDEHGSSDDELPSPSRRRNHSGEQDDEVSHPRIDLTPASLARARSLPGRNMPRQVVVLYQGPNSQANNSIYLITLGNVDFRNVPIRDLRGRQLESSEMTALVNSIVSDVSRIERSHYFYLGMTTVGVIQRALGHNQALITSRERRLYNAIHTSGAGASMHTLLMGVHPEQLTQIESLLILALGGLEALGLNSNAGSSVPISTGAPGNIELTPNTQTPGEGSRRLVTTSGVRIEYSQAGDGPTAWQNTVYSITEETVSFSEIPIIDLAGIALNDQGMRTLAATLLNSFIGSDFQRYIGRVGSGESGERTLQARAQEHRQAVAENSSRRLPFTIQRWNTAGQAGAMHALVVNIHPDQLAQVEGIAMVAANSMGSVGLNSVSPSRQLFGESSLMPEFLGSRTAPMEQSGPPAPRPNPANGLTISRLVTGLANFARTRMQNALRQFILVAQNNARTAFHLSTMTLGGSKMH